MPNASYVPLMFQAQIPERANLQYAADRAPSAYKWVSEWQAGTNLNGKPSQPFAESKSYRIPWRLVTNSGQDESIIRPVIGSHGWMYYPGSSMKGAFLRHCDKDEARLYCGGLSDNDETVPATLGLRFHGGYPADDTWCDASLVDIVHEQQGWQVRGNEAHSGVVQIAALDTKWTFGISSPKQLTPQQWQKIWQIWEKALAQGLGSRTSAGYGQVKMPRQNAILKVKLKGEGVASKRFDEVEEFRPNLFKASLRGHTLRLFGGLTDATTAERSTEALWGGIG
ncbi:hypothetical protein IQ266_25680, partial [filamentous cyanobacterium LEGE 11480]